MNGLPPLKSSPADVFLHGPRTTTVGGVTTLLPDCGKGQMFWSLLPVFISLATIVKYHSLGDLNYRHVFLLCLEA